MSSYALIDGADALAAAAYGVLTREQAAAHPEARRRLRSGAWRRLEPTIPSFDGGAYSAWLNGETAPSRPPGALMTPGGFHSFEHRWALSAALDLHERIGRRRIAERTRGLAGQLKRGLAANPRVRLRTPVDESLSSGLVCFELRDLAARTTCPRRGACLPPGSRPIRWFPGGSGASRVSLTASCSHGAGGGRCSPSWLAPRLPSALPRSTPSRCCG